MSSMPIRRCYKYKEKNRKICYFLNSQIILVHFTQSKSIGCHEIFQREEIYNILYCQKTPRCQKMFSREDIHCFKQRQNTRSQRMLTREENKWVLHSQLPKRHQIKINSWFRRYNNQCEYQHVALLYSNHDLLLCSSN